MSDNEDADLTNPPDTASGGAPEQPDKPSKPEGPSKPEEPEKNDPDGTPVENPSG